MRDPILIEVLIEELRAMEDTGDPELSHIAADDLLLRYIADDRVTDAFSAVPRWYA